MEKVHLVKSVVSIRSMSEHCKQVVILSSALLPTRLSDVCIFILMHPSEMPFSGNKPGQRLTHQPGSTPAQTCQITDSAFSKHRNRNTDVQIRVTGFEVTSSGGRTRTAELQLSLDHSRSQTQGGVGDGDIIRTRNKLANSVIVGHRGNVYYTVVSP